MGTNCTTNPEQIEIMELEGYSPLMYNELCASSHDAFDRPIGDVVQARPSTSFVDNAIDLPWRNLEDWEKQICAGKYPYFGRCQNFLITQCKIGGRKLPCQNSSIPSAVSTEFRLVTD